MRIFQLSQVKKLICSSDSAWSVWLKTTFGLWIRAIFDWFFWLWKLKSRPHSTKSREILDGRNSKIFMANESSTQNLESHTSLTSDDIIINRKWRHHKWFDFHIAREIHRISNVKNQLITTLLDKFDKIFWNLYHRKYILQKFHANPTCNSRVIAYVLFLEHLRYYRF